MLLVNVHMWVCQALVHSSFVMGILHLVSSPAMGPHSDRASSPLPVKCSEKPLRQGHFDTLLVSKDSMHGLLQVRCLASSIISTLQARCSHVAGMADQLLLISGGSYYAQPGKLEALSDLWLYDTQARVRVCMLFPCSGMKHAVPVKDGILAYCIMQYCMHARVPL